MNLKEAACVALKVSKENPQRTHLNNFPFQTSWIAIEMAVYDRACIAITK